MAVPGFKTSQRIVAVLYLAGVVYASTWIPWYRVVAYPYSRVINEGYAWVWAAPYYSRPALSEIALRLLALTGAAGAIYICVSLLPHSKTATDSKSSPRGTDKQKAEEGRVSTADVQGEAEPQSRLSEAQIERVKRIQANMSDVDPSSLAKWIQDFEKDGDPEWEIRTWESIAGAYQSYCKSQGFHLSAEAKGDVLQLLLRRADTDNLGEIELHADLSVLTKREIREVVKHYRDPARPIEVERMHETNRRTP